MRSAYNVNPKIVTVALSILGVMLAGVSSLNNYVLVLAISLLLLVFLVVQKKFLFCLFISPFAVISLMPSQYSSFFRYASPLGDLRPDFIMVLMVLAWFTFFSLKKVDLTGIRMQKWLLITTSFFFLVNIISIVANRLTFNNFRYTLFIYIFSFGIVLLAALARKVINPIKALKAYLVISSIVCLLGILEFLGIAQPYGGLYIADNEWFAYMMGSNRALPRIVSSVGNPLVLSGYLLLMIPVSLYIKEISKKKMTWNIVIGMHLLSLLLTQSRSAFLVGLIIVLYYSTKNIKIFFRNTITLALVGVFTVLLLTLMGYGQAFEERLTFNSEGESITIRLQAFYDAHFLLKQGNNALIGLGPNMVNEALETLSFSPVQTLDNVFLMTVVSVGIIGLIAYLSMYWVLWRKFSVMNKSLRKLGYSLLLVMFGMGFSYNVTYFTVVWGVFWSITSLIIIYHYQIKDKQSITQSEQKAD